jgi:hypothetical protein
VSQAEVVHTKQEIPDIFIGPNDVHILIDILHPYTIYVQQIFSSGYTGIKVAEINNLRSRFLNLLRSSDEQPILLTPHEFEIINEAFDLFLRTIPQVVPASEERDEALQSCRNIQEAFRKQKGGRGGR